MGTFVRQPACEGGVFLVEKVCSGPGGRQLTMQRLALEGEMPFHEASLITKEAIMAILGTEERPAVVRVATPERAAAVQVIAEHQGWLVIVGVEPDEREDLTDLELLITGGQAVSAKVGRNDPCPCGSGKKHKKCCAGGPSAVEALVAATAERLAEASLPE